MGRKRTRGWIVALLGVGLPLWGTGCGLGRSTGDGPSLVRFIETDPEEIFELATVVERRRVFTWSFSRQDEIAPWTAAPRGQGLAVRQGVAVPVESRQPLILTREVGLEASSVAVLVIEAKGLPKREVQLRWTRAGGGPLPGAQLRRPPKREKKTQLVTFELGNHPQWTGEIGSIEIRFPPGTGDGAQITGIWGENRVIDKEQLGKALSRSWKIAIGNEVRNALLAPPGRVTSRQVEVPADGRFQVAYALQPGVSIPVRFRAVVDRDGGEGQEVILDEMVPPDKDAAWRQVTLDLDRFAGHEISLRLETSTDGELLPEYGFPVWAHPVLFSASEHSAQPNVILISIDTLRADHLSLYGYERPTSPELEAWARDSAVVFRSAVAQAPWTLPSHASMLTGLNAHRHGVNHTGPVPDGLITLAERLREVGYRTLAATGGGWLAPSSGFTQGFDVYRYPLALRDPEELKNNLEAALRWLDSPGPRPLFLFLHTYEVHWPYRAREPYFSRFSRHQIGNRRIVFREGFLENGLQRVRYLSLREPGSGGKKALPSDLADLPIDLYDSGIAYADAELKQLFTRLRQPDLAGRTAVVLTSDHGEMLGEHGLGSHYYLYDENLLVPLVVAAPGKQGAGSEVGEQVRVIDVVPTVLELAGLPAAPRIDGASLVPLMEGRGSSGSRVAMSYAAKSNFGMAIRLRNRFKYIFNHAAWPSLHGREMLFQLNQDPTENHDVAASMREAEALREQMRSSIEESAGVRVGFKNSSARILAGRLQGTSIWKGKVKAIEMPCDCVVWRGAGVMEFEVPPGIAFTLVLEGVADRHLKASVALLAPGERLPNVDQSIELSTLVQPHTLAFYDSAWHFDTSASTPDHLAGLSFWWHGEAFLDLEAPAEIDANTQAQLRALGYL